MKHRLHRVLSLALALCLVLTALIGMPVSAADNETALRVGTAKLSGCFSPFFSENAYDNDVVAMTGANLLETDRQGMVVEKSKTGETRPYHGTNYTYNGIADVTVTENADGTVAYDFDLRNDVLFSDGEKLTADDVIFSMYVLADPTYDGSSTFSALPIVGMEAYRAGMAPLYRLLLDAGEDNTDFSLWTKATQNMFWDELFAAGPAFAKSIVDYVIANGWNEPGDSVAACAASWGYDLAEDATAADFWAAIVAAYDGDIAMAASVEQADVSLWSLMDNFDTYSKGVQTGESAASIAGIVKTGDYSVRVTLARVDAAAIYQLGVPVAPLHYYGDAAQYDYANNRFGFPKGDLSSVRAKNAAPMGAGPYKFVQYENGVVSFEANEQYFKGAPKTKNVQFIEAGDQDKLNGVADGTLDVAEPGYSADTISAIRNANGSDSVNGPVITTYTTDNLGYGYIGMSAEAMNVGGDKGSDASKNLRKAFATVLANYRDESIGAYFGGVASVINYPISNTSWAAPQAGDPGYEVAFSRDAAGSGIYTAGMDAAAREAACLQAALGYFKAAGYTVENGKVTAAPAGASMRYEVWIPGGGAGDHPSFGVVQRASAALARIGIELVVKDLTNSADLWIGIEAGTVPMWCAAWGATPDPDLYQVYYSGSQGGEAGGSNYMYDIADEQLDRLILQARQSTDQACRKQIYQQCLGIILDWAVEVPVYQRQNAVIVSTERVDTSTVTPDITPFYGWMAEIENLCLKGFTDVSSDAYYADPVEWAVENGITLGIGNNQFGPDLDCTRGQIVTFLWRAKGCPEPKSTKNPFTDVSSGQYYYRHGVRRHR